MSDRPRWRFWIRTGDGIYDARYYEFKNFKVYWAYRWLIAEQMDSVGCLSGMDSTMTKRVETNYSQRYIK